MKVSQLIHTSCRNNGLTNRGYITYGKSSDITDKEEEIIVSTMNYKLRNDYQFNADEKTIDNTFPRKLAFFKLETGRYCLAQSCYVGLDCDGNRYGNYFIHAFVFNSINDISPMSFAGSEQFRRRFDKATIDGPIAVTLPQIDLKDEPRRENRFSIKLGNTFKKLVIFLRNEPFKSGDKIIVRVPNQDIAPLLRLFANNIYNKQDPISFLTYRQNSSSIDEVFPNVTLYFDDKNNTFPQGAYHVYSFDLVEDTTNVNVDINSFDNVWLDLLINDESKAIEFENKIEDVADKYGIDDLLDAYYLLSVIEGDYQKAGGARNAAELYAKYLAKNNPPMVASNIFNALSESDKNDYTLLNKLYAGLDERVRAVIISRYITSIINQGDRRAIVEKVNRPDISSKEEVLDEIFNKGLDKSFSSKEAQLALFDLAIDKKPESYLVNLLNNYSGDLDDIYQIYRNRLGDKHYTSFASTLFDKMKGHKFSIDELKAFYNDLDSKRKEAIVDGYFNSVINAKGDIFEVRSRIIDNNPFLSRNEALKYVKDSLIEKLIVGDDYQKLLALTFVEELHFDGKLVQKIFNSLSKKDKSIERVIFEIIDHLKTQKDVLLALYLQATLDQYKRPEEATNLIARLADSSFFQGQTLTQFYDKKILSLEEVMDLVKQYPGMEGEEIDSIRQLVKNRDNPNKNKELFENNKENSVFKDYIKNVYSKDFDREVRSIKEPQEALQRLRSYKLDANATKYLLGIVFKDDLSVDALARMIDEKLLIELGQIAKHNGTTLPVRSKEVEAYYAIRRGAMGEFKPLIALGYPEKRVYDFPLTPKFVEVMYRYVRECIKKSDNKIEAIHSLLEPFPAINQNFESLAEKDYSSEEDIKLIIEYLKKYPQRNGLSTFFENRINKYLSKFAHGKVRQEEAKRLGIKDNEYKKYKRGGKFSSGEVVGTLCSFGFYALIRKGLKI